MKIRLEFILFITKLSLKKMYEIMVRIAQQSATFWFQMVVVNTRQRKRKIKLIWNILNQVKFWTTTAIIGKRVSMGLTVSRKTAKNLTVNRKKS